MKHFAFKSLWCHRRPASPRLGLHDSARKHVRLSAPRRWLACHGAHWLSRGARYCSSSQKNRGRPGCIGMCVSWFRLSIKPLFRAPARKTKWAYFCVAVHVDSRTPVRLRTVPRRAFLPAQFPRVSAPGRPMETLELWGQSAAPQSGPRPKSSAPGRRGSSSRVAYDRSPAIRGPVGAGAPSQAEPDGGLTADDTSPDLAFLPSPHNPLWNIPDACTCL